MTQSFVLRANERGHNVIYSDGPASSYVAGHPGGFISRESSFNFHEYQDGRPGFGAIRVFGDETFHGAGCGYNMHPHHNFVICAFVLDGELTHINTAGRGMVDPLRQGDYYVFSAGSGGKHCELSIGPEEMNAIYLWLMPNQLFLPPTYHRAHFDLRTRRNRIVQLVGDAEGALPVAQDLRVSRLVTDRRGTFTYTPRSPLHGVYVFVAEGELRCGDVTLSRRDSLGLSGTAAIACDAADTTDVFFVETVMPDQARIDLWEAAGGHDH
ncbi:MAG TPA: pirin family protein [Rhodopila sp.]|uniref:pirin family protein n=1 Tax=Rhodopila sp. TaxID=2480087 RepID=UPI002B9DBF0E|nr:pirin family protein [Rhodopila sp.]HVY16970.1 pirin family protein [Rhodopila sp.]